MLAIAIDSSQDICTLALGKDGQLISEYHFFHKMNLLKRIVPDIDDLLSDAGYSVRDLECIIISLGPGSFTGLRIGVTIAKSLAFVLNKPIVGIGTLDAIARSSAPSEADYICPMIFARAKEVYWSLFDSTGSSRLLDYAVSPIDEVLGKLAEKDGRIRFCGTGATRNTQDIKNRLEDKAIISEPWANFARGAALLDMGMKRLAEDNVDNALILSPLYVRKPTPVIKLEATSGDIG